MDQLWAAWRHAYVKAPKDDDDGCIFCAAPSPPPDSDQAADTQCKVIGYSTHAYAMLNRYPYTNGHVLVMPLRHCADLHKLPAPEAADLHELLVRVVAAVKTAYACDGLNVGLNMGAAAGAGLGQHLHYHVVPRWAGDTNFMPVVAGAKVIPESLDSSFQLLRDALRNA
jgi:ATP adenylyltransferase